MALTDVLFSESEDFELELPIGASPEIITKDGLTLAEAIDALLITTRNLQNIAASQL